MMNRSNRRSGFLSRFLRYLFKGEINSPPRIYETYSLEIERSLEAESHSRERVANQLIVTINKLLIFICLASFIVMIIFPFIDKATPDTIQNIFFTTLGWFGSAFATFFQIENNTKSE